LCVLVKTKKNDCAQDDFFYKKMTVHKMTFFYETGGGASPTDYIKTGGELPPTR
jgi:hypothetical protein